jgi:hypothetical protein
VAGSATRTGKLAYDVYALRPLGQDGGLAERVGGHQWRSRLGGGDVGQLGRSRPSACRRRPKKNGAQALGRSRGGFGTKIHAIVDALGNPIGFTLTGSEQTDITQANALLDQVPEAGAVIADKGYDADALVERIKWRRAEAIIPPRAA